MNKPPENGTLQNFDGKECIYFDGYWIRHYPLPHDTLASRKKLIDSLTKRTFHHTESGINTPGNKLEEARQVYEDEQDPARKRVNGAMLAGALFNRATDIFTSIVELEEKGVEVNPRNELMRQCGECFKEALELGKQVKHYSGHEGIDELWGEPLKAFTQPLEHLFESRYIKIASAMKSIDLVTDELIESLQQEKSFSTASDLLNDFRKAAKLQVETMKSDPSFFKVWPAFIASREALDAFIPKTDNLGEDAANRIYEGVKLITSGAALITYLSEARVPMPKSTEEFLKCCKSFRQGKRCA